MGVGVSNRGVGRAIVGGVVVGMGFAVVRLVDFGVAIAIAIAIVGVGAIVGVPITGVRRAGV